MHGITFRIFPLENLWGWQTLGADRVVLHEGVVASRAVAAAMVIRDTIAQTTDAPRLRQRAA